VPGQRAEQAVEQVGAPAAGVVAVVDLHRLHHLGALLPGLHHFRQQRGRMLQVAVHQHDRVAARMLKARGQRRFLAEVARQAQAPDGRVRGALPFDGAPGVVGRAVVHQHQLPGSTQGLQHADDLRQRGVQVRGLAVQRDHQGQGGGALRRHGITVHGRQRPAGR
jgi:hypothetical protein